MAKMYLFRKLSELNQQQSDVCEEAVSSVLDDVLKGKTSTVFSFGNWIDWSTAGANQAAPQDMVARILNDLFSHVYSLEVTMEINISIRHMQLYITDDPLQHKSAGGDCLKKPLEHFVASADDVYVYMEKVIQSDQKVISSDYSYVVFSICVRQTNLEQSVHLQGSLQLVHLLDIDQPVLLQLDTPMGALLKMLSALASNTKTHLRYYNVRLTRILKDLLGSVETTVIFNYTAMPDVQLDAVSTRCCAILWKALYMRERKKCEALNEKIFSLEYWSNEGQKLQLEKGNKSSQLMDEEEQPELCAELKQIKADVKASFEELLQVQHIMAQLELQFEQHGQQLEQKNQMLSKLHKLLAKAKKKMHRQRIGFQNKLAFYAEMFRSLWQQQRLALQQQEQEREVQLSKMFDTIYNERQSTHVQKLEQDLVDSGRQDV